jgi:hypothetical protein
VNLYEEAGNGRQEQALAGWLKEGKEGRLSESLYR